MEVLRKGLHKENQVNYKLVGVCFKKIEGLVKTLLTTQNSKFQPQVGIRTYLRFLLWKLLAFLDPQHLS